MVNNLGVWTAEEDYSVYPKAKWCDCDYVAAWIKDLGYKSQTTIENLVGKILLHYNSYLDYSDLSFYTDMEVSENHPMISVKDVLSYVAENGGLEEFDYES